MPNWPAAKMLDTVMATPVDALPVSAEEARKVETLLLRVGISAVGARQVVLAQPMTSPSDRQRIAKLLATMVGF